MLPFQDQRLWHHSRRMEETLNANSPRLQEYLDGMTASLGSPQAALEMLSGIIQRDAFVMTYNDVSPEELIPFDALRTLCARP